MRFDAVELPEETVALRQEVRAFLKEEKSTGTLAGHSADRTAHAAEFSRRVGERGWIGMTWPKKYGGHERTALERYVVSEELLAAGAPVSAHWVADRQSGNLLLRFGTEEQREKILPGICRGETCFCIGLSEPNSGSDLASVETTAHKVDGGWLVNGTKLWTSWAHKAQYMCALLRTEPKGENKHEGLSQLLIDMALPNIEVRPVYNLSGRHDFNEVVFSDCLVPDDMLVGHEGQGWEQVTSELGYERSGPERFLSTFYLYIELVRALGSHPSAHEKQTIGRLAAHLMTLRRMSISVAGMLQAGQALTVEASLVKDVGTQFEREIPEIARCLIASDEFDVSNGFRQALNDAVLLSPGLTIRGGAREILRVVVARGLGL